MDLITVTFTLLGSVDENLGTLSPVEPAVFPPPPPPPEDEQPPIIITPPPFLGGVPISGVTTPPVVNLNLPGSLELIWKDGLRPTEEKTDEDENAGEKSDTKADEPVEKKKEAEK